MKGRLPGRLGLASGLLTSIRQREKKAAKAAETNDPYFPKPPSHVSRDEDDKLWEVFSSMYLNASENILRVEFDSALALDDPKGGLLAWAGIVWKSGLKEKIEKTMDLPRVFLSEWRTFRAERAAKGWLY
jgi:hypothetical protein